MFPAARHITWNSLIASGVTREVFFDTQTHLIVREIIPPPALKFSPVSDKTNSQTAETQPAGASEEIDYFDYKPVTGILEPNRMELHRDGHIYQIAVTRVEINAPVQDSIFDFPRREDRPLPDIAKLLLDIDKNQRTVEEILKQYTCHLSEEEEKTDSNGQVSSRSVKEYDMFYIGEDEIRHLLAKDGKPLEGDEKKKEDERFSKDFRREKEKTSRTPKRPQKAGKTGRRGAGPDFRFSSRRAFHQSATRTFPRTGSDRLRFRAQSRLQAEKTG